MITKRIKTLKIRNMKLPTRAVVKCSVGCGVGVGIVTFYDADDNPLFKYETMGREWYLEDLTPEATDE